MSGVGRIYSIEKQANDNDGYGAVGEAGPCAIQAPLLPLPARGGGCRWGSGLRRASRKARTKRFCTGPPAMARSARSSSSRCLTPRHAGRPSTCRRSAAQKRARLTRSLSTTSSCSGRCRRTHRLRRAPVLPRRRRPRQIQCPARLGICRVRSRLYQYRRRMNQTRAQALAEICKI